MKIETYQNGVLIEVREIEITSSPNVAAFNTQMMLSDNYTLLTENTSNQQAKTRLEIASVRLELKAEITKEDLTIFQFLWDAVIDGLSENILISVDRDELNQIAQINNMPFAFGNDFKMILAED